MTAAAVLLTAAAVPVLLAAGYLLLLTLLSRDLPAARPSTARRFRIVVPAHDEERGIATTIRSLQATDYPADRREIVVVADNCSDGTAAAARAAGARVLTRRDPARRGKGYALAHAVEHLQAEAPEAWDALVIVDADTTVTPNLLRAAAARLDAGDRAVQAAYLPRTSGGHPLGVVTEVAFTAIHVVRSTARERLGLSCGLRGNGMAFTRTVLATVPHDAFSRTEDLEYGIRLGLAGVRVAYAGEATVRGDMPDRAEVVATQRRRWIGGRIEIGRTYLPALLRGAVRTRSAMLLDLAVDLLIPPLSVLVLALTVGLLGAAAALLLRPTSIAPLAAWGTAAAALSAHVLYAAQRARRLGALLRSSLILPGYALGKAWIAIRELRTPETAWVRTARTGEIR